MRRSLYLTIAGLAGQWLAELTPGAVEIDSGCELPAVKAVYIAMNAERGVDYVGSVARIADARALSSRVREHVRDRDRSDRWVQLYVVRLVTETPASEVRRIEGLIGVVLKPVSNRRLPRTGLPSSSPRTLRRNARAPIRPDEEEGDSAWSWPRT